mmetsp:Transcript_24130/g.39062  ORF Transcript_24130/g.39062 Transcript_24130/m.39062 type:complete len:758 (+) Transcript_24130:102-2375(+)
MADRMEHAVCTDACSQESSILDARHVAPNFCLTFQDEDLDFPTQGPADCGSDYGGKRDSQATLEETQDPHGTDVTVEETVQDSQRTLESQMSVDCDVGKEFVQESLAHDGGNVEQDWGDAQDAVEDNQETPESQKTLPETQHRVQDQDLDGPQSGLVAKEGLNVDSGKRSAKVKGGSQEAPESRKTLPPTQHSFRDQGPHGPQNGLVAQEEAGGNIANDDHCCSKGGSQETPEFQKTLPETQSNVQGQDPQSGLVVKDEPNVDSGTTITKEKHCCSKGDIKEEPTNEELNISKSQFMTQALNMDIYIPSDEEEDSDEEEEQVKQEVKQKPITATQFLTQALDMNVTILSDEEADSDSDCKDGEMNKENRHVSATQFMTQALNLLPDNIMEDDDEDEEEEDGGTMKQEADGICDKKTTMYKGKGGAQEVTQVNGQCKADILTTNQGANQTGVVNPCKLVREKSSGIQVECSIQNAEEALPANYVTPDVKNTKEADQCEIVQPADTKVNPDRATSGNENDPYDTEESEEEYTEQMKRESSDSVNLPRDKHIPPQMSSTGDKQLHIGQKRKRPVKKDDESSISSLDDEWIDSFLDKTNTSVVKKKQLSTNERILTERNKSKRVVIKTEPNGRSRKVQKSPKELKENIGNKHVIVKKETQPTESNVQSCLKTPSIRKKADRTDVSARNSKRLAKRKVAGRTLSSTRGAHKSNKMIDGSSDGKETHAIDSMLGLGKQRKRNSMVIQKRLESWFKKKEPIAVD